MMVRVAFPPPLLDSIESEYGRRKSSQ